MTKLVNCKTEEACESYSSSPPEQRLKSHSQSSSSDLFSNSLHEAVAAQVKSEEVSFHTPGHKGRKGDAATTNVSPNLSPSSAAVDLASDLTELPGLDDLSAPDGVIKELNQRAARLWKAKNSILSVNGASAGIVAAILSVASRGSKLLVPRNAHKSVINGLVLSGLSPVWYEPEWNADWCLFDAVASDKLQVILQDEQHDLAAMVVVSPTYGGTVSDIKTISALCREKGIALIVDEAHGAHLLPGSPMPQSAIAFGADVVIHSLHKTLGALTQTGVVHITNDSLISEEELQSFLNVMQSTSPSYPLLLSIESAINELEGFAGEKILHTLRDLSEKLRTAISNLQGYSLHGGDNKTASHDPLHVLISHRSQPAVRLYQYLTEQGIFPETILGNGVLFMLGVGSTSRDINLLVDALTSFHEYCATADTTTYQFDVTQIERPASIDQIMTPREAALAPSKLVPREEAENHIASECIAPCPPGMPLCLPGQKLTKEVLKQISKPRIRIVS